MLTNISNVKSTLCLTITVIAELLTTLLVFVYVNEDHFHT